MKLYSGLWLALVAVHETPPHIALISDGGYYSLSARKVDNGSPLERFINTLQRKHIPTLFIHIETGKEIRTTLQKTFKGLKPLSDSETTCLSPIKQFFTANYSPEFLQVNYVFELLAIAEQKGILKECISIFGINGNSNHVTLHKYTMEQIRNKIHQIASLTPPINS